jgi:outer membrane protein assembly factor BamB
VRPQWRIEVEPGLYAGPVIGPGGVIYLGQLGEGLLAVDPDGTELWTGLLSGIEGESVILSTPAVADDGSIYIISTDYEDEVSTLHKISSSGSLLWNLTLPKPTTASPTAWEDLVFIAAYREVNGSIFVVDADGNLLQDQSQEVSDPCTVNPENWFGEVAGILVDFFSSFPPGVEYDGSSGVTKPPFALQPTLTVVDEQTIGGLANPVVIMPQICSVLFYEWTGSGLVRLQHDFLDNERHGFTSAAVSPSGRVVIGSQDGRLRTYLIDPTVSPTGIMKDWTHDLNQPIWLDPAATPVPAVKEIFVVTAGRVWAFSADGDDVDSIVMGDVVTTPPVLSADHVFVGTEGGLVTLDWSLELLGEAEGVTPWLYRSPAIGEEGEVVLGEADGLVRFGGP